VGRPRGALAEAARDYEGRLGKVLRFEAIDVRDGRPFVQHLGGCHVVCLDRGGRTMTSGELAAFVRDREELPPQRTVFVIGGPDGLPSAVLEAADTRLSLGALTLPHQLARVVLVEQLYRATTILRGEPYHR
jgi:23S rRNA (pseudouridine1915-N3)-methyltransferase